MTHHISQNTSSITLPDGITTALRQRRFERIVVFSGAGMSADSGIATFRSGGKGLWQEFNPADLATPAAWKRDASTVWGWYEWRRGQVMQAQPHAGHVAVAQLQNAHGASIVTQNVDDLHERAGAGRVLHLHGSLFAARCDVCGQPHALDAPPPTAQRQITPPRCSDVIHCRGAVRPGVVWFGERLPDEVVEQAAELIAACDLLLIVGTSGVVQPAASLVELAPKEAVIIEINPDEMAAQGRARLHLPWTAAQGLPVLQELLAEGVAS